MFDATDVRATSGGWRLNGALAARGATIPITLIAPLATGPTNGQLTVRATTRIDRRDLGIKAPRLMIGHEVVIQIDARFRAG